MDAILASAPALPFGLGDCGLAVSLVWLDLLAPVLGLDWPLPPAVQTWGARTVAVPAVAAALEVYRPALTDWLADAAP